MSNLSYYFDQIWDDYGDQRVRNFPLLRGGPWRVISLSLVYLAFVKHIGPRLMKNREPFDLRAFILLYNSFLIGFNGVGIFVVLWLTEFGSKTWNCLPINNDPRDFKAALFTNLGYLYFMSKIADFLDTIFFVLRKRHRQITVLHVFHHGIMPVIGYIGLKFHPGPMSAFFPIINTVVHSVMYFYYALSVSGPDMKKYLWWKKYITQIQLIQFVACFIHSCYTLFHPNCSFPKLLAFLEGLHSVIFFVMFWNFYRKSYAMIQNSQSKASEKSTEQSVKCRKED